MNGEDAVERLRRRLADELGGEIAGLRRLSAGASRETWSFSAGDEPLILQRSRVAAGIGASVDEPAVVRAAHAAGVRVPEIVASSSSGDHPIGPLFTITRHIAGESIARKILRDDDYATARDRFVEDCARELAAIHAIDRGPLGEALPEMTDPVEAQTATYELIGDPHPVFDLAFRRLDENRPVERAPTVVHGDFRMGNFLIDGEGIAAVLDWELAHAGNPVEDLGWLCARAWRFGSAGAVGGIGSRQELLDAYVAAGGFAVELAELRWWETLASLRWGVITMFMGDEYRRGATASLEQAAIGRRVVETEYDVMLLLREDIPS